MAKAGLIVNPNAGKDIRRLSARASFSSNFIKIDLSKRVIVGLNASGVDEIMLMRDMYGLGNDIVNDLSEAIRSRLTVVDTPCHGTAQDTIAAASRMRSLGASSIVVIGGDGTMRTAFKGSRDVPLVCVPAGTNNVLGSSFEATLVGLAAGLVATKLVDVRNVVKQMKLLEIIVNDRFRDVALIDVAVTSLPFIGARAIVNVDRLVRIMLTKGEPGDIGLASIAGFIKPISLNDDDGALLELGEDGVSVNAVIAPGLIKTVKVKRFQLIKIGDVVDMPCGNYSIAFDGERELEITEEDYVKVRLTRSGPPLIDVGKALNEFLRPEYNLKGGSNLGF